jgi:hypothetical protein
MNVFLGALLFLCAVSFAGERVDIIVAEKIGLYTVFDRYQQELTPRQKHDFPSFAPFVVENEEATLGDGITPAVHVRHEGISYYFMVDDRGRLVGGDAGDFLKRYRRCIVYNDTIEITRDGALVMSVRGRESDNRLPLRRGDLAKRLFGYRDLYYLKLLDGEELYGWCGLRPAGAWEKFSHEQAATAAFDADLQERIADRLDRVNATYAGFVAEFNRISGQSKRPPEWVVHNDEAGVQCVLNAKPSTIRALRGSTRYVVQEIENLLIGRPLSVRYEDGVIMVGGKTVRGLGQ